MQLPTYQDVLDAEPIVHGYLRPTLCNRWPLLAERLGVDLWLKHENHQPTGAFKVRGGINLVRRLSDGERAAGIIGCTTGNHGQSLAYAAAKFGVRCVLVVPEGNNPGKSAAMRSLGAELIEHGRDFDEAKTYCEQVAAEQGLRYVHSANEPHLIAGVGTMALELLEDLPQPDVVLVPIGLGSGICGTSLVLAERSPQTRIIGVQAAGAPAVAESWKAGRIVTHLSVDTFAEGLATRRAAELTLAIMREHVDDIVLVDDQAIRRALGWLLADTHNLAEPAGAATVAAAWQMREELAGMRVAAVISGGNCDLRVLPGILQQLEDERD